MEKAKHGSPEKRSLFKTTLRLRVAGSCPPLRGERWCGQPNAGYAPPLAACSVPRNRMLESKYRRATEKCAQCGAEGVVYYTRAKGNQCEKCLIEDRPQQERGATNNELRSQNIAQ
jgi:hypothetical protein